MARNLASFRRLKRPKPASGPIGFVPPKGGVGFSPPNKSWLEIWLRFADSSDRSQRRGQLASFRQKVGWALARQTNPCSKFGFVSPTQATEASVGANWVRFAKRWG